MKSVNLNRMKFRLAAVVSLAFAIMPFVHADNAKSHIASRTELDYGPVLYEFYQRDYFLALIEDEFAFDILNPQARSAKGQLLKGGMLINYGLPKEAMKLFNQLLDGNTTVEVRNRAWFHLAKLYYQKSDINNANRALDRIRGDMPRDLRIDYHYLASLIKNEGRHFIAVDKAINSLSGELPKYTYLQFNLAVVQLRDGNALEAVNKLEEIADYSGTNRELLALSDRAKHGLAQMATQAGNLPRAWNYLTGIRTTGLYSNRALLSYAWTAIKMKMFNEAIPALQLLDARSIAIPEVQEAKVLLAHLYEQEGSPRKALKSNLLAEKAFQHGIETVDEARAIIAKRDVPKEFIQNLEAIMDESNWYRASASVDYRKLTPFLIDLMASNPFHETLKDLAALYSLEENLKYWWSQTNEHKLILENARNKNVLGQLKELLERGKVINDQLLDQKTEIELTTLTLTDEDKKRFNALIETSEQDLRILSDKINQLSNADEPYAQPKHYEAWVLKNHKRIEDKLAQTRVYIRQLEPVMRSLVNRELDKHEERMRYYWAQSRLAKARLFDSTLLDLENAKTLDSEPEIQKRESE